MSRVRVFISHSARDGKANGVRQAICDRLKADPNYAVLMDDVSLDPGDAWRARINLWIGSCDAAIVIVSPEALKSDYVFFELSVLGYRRWRAQRDAKDFLIIPVFTGVTIAEVGASRLKDAQAEEWMGINEGNDEAAIAGQVVAKLKDVVAADSIPIERMARVLDSHLPPSDAQLDDAATAVGYELPWDVAYGKSLSLALRLLGSGMTQNCIKAVRHLRRAPAFREPSLDTIIGLLSSAWVDVGAQRIRALLGNTPPPLLLNATVVDIAQMYMRALSYQEPPLADYYFTDVNFVIDEKKDDEEYRKSALEAVRQALYAKLNVSTKKELATELAEAAARDEPVVVTMYAPLIMQKTVAALTAEFEHVIFLLRTGPKGDVSLAGDSVHVIHPPLKEKDEEQFREDYDKFGRGIRKPLGDR